MKLSNLLQRQVLVTPLGEMVAIANEKALCFLTFVDQSRIEHRILSLKRHMYGDIVDGTNGILLQIQHELDLYFQGRLRHFATPLLLQGTPFQTGVWQSLQSIPYGHTWSYKALAESIAHPKAVRAVANANAANGVAIVVPCHRVIQANRSLGGYAGGLCRKQSLLELEQAL